MPKKTRKPQEIQDFLSLAQDRFKLSASAESTMRASALDDLRFSTGEQWATDIKADRESSGRVCLTINVLPTYIRQVTNEQRQQRPAIAVNPVGNGADVDTAEILQGIIRHIEVNSDAEVAYDTAFDSMVRTGSGGWRITTKFKNAEGDEQEIAIEPIKDWFSVYSDPESNLPDHSDEKWKFIVKEVSEQQFRRDYPDSQLAKGLASLDDYMSVGDAPAIWASNDGQIPFIRVAEYYYVEDDKVHWAVISARDIHDEEETIWSSIPIVGVYGDEQIVNGKIYRAGLVRNAKDPQRAKNYWTSAATEMIALAPKAPFIATKKQIAAYTKMYEQANRRNLAYLLYDMDTTGGTAAPPPSRNVAEPPIQAMNTMLMLSQNDLYATTGLYPANIGKTQDSQESGRAVIARKQQGELSNLHYSDNLARSIRLTGRLILKGMRKVYTAPKIQRIIKPDASVTQVGLFNSENSDQQEAESAIQQLDPNIRKIFDIGVGEYDVTVSVGPSYQTKRQEAAATQLELVKADPQLMMPIMGDILVGNMDIPGSQEIAKRLKKAVPPQFQDSDDPDAQQQQLVAQHAQLVQQVQFLSQQLMQANQTIATKKVEQDGKFAIEHMKSSMDTDIQKLKIAAQIAIAQIGAKTQITSDRESETNDVWEAIHGAAHEKAMQDAQQAHEQALAQLQSVQSQQSQQSDQAHEFAMSQVNQNGNGQGK